jgi:hypothetical protein
MHLAHMQLIVSLLAAPGATAHATRDEVEVLPAPLPPDPGAPIGPSAPPDYGRGREPRRSATEPAPGSDHPQAPLPSSEWLPDRRLLHGFRVGYGHTLDYDKPVKSLGDKSLADRTGMRSPHNFLIGYEAFYRMVGHSWLNVILVGNVIVAGLEQSQFYPTGNTLLGFEFNNSFQLGVGANFAPLKGAFAHTIFAAGWTPKVGSFYTPLHAYFIPDVDGVHRIGVLTGVTW